MMTKRCRVVFVVTLSSMLPSHLLLPAFASLLREEGGEIHNAGPATGQDRVNRVCILLRTPASARVGLQAPIDGGRSMEKGESMVEVVGVLYPPAWHPLAVSIQRINTPDDLLPDAFHVSQPPLVASITAIKSSCPCSYNPVLSTTASSKACREDPSETRRRDPPTASYHHLFLCWTRLQCTHSAQRHPKSKSNSKTSLTRRRAQPPRHSSAPQHHLPTQLIT
ncbi:hypothetical protein IWZ00DRAFT_149 [Phyllosticta capitalensis]|uniref:uncharacterized protein n=1 Tax=Phyllosticta capitalensis TaxID=121624 RepID=UPI0031320C18